MLSGLKILESTNPVSIMVDAREYAQEKFKEGHNYLFILFRDADTFLFPCQKKEEITAEHLKNKYQANRVEIIEKEGYVPEEKKITFEEAMGHLRNVNAWRAPLVEVKKKSLIEKFINKAKKLFKFV